MAYCTNQAWVTSVVTDETVSRALVLEKSIRRTRTTKQIVAITSNNVSLENRCKLRKGFDLVFGLEESWASGGRVGDKDQEDALAKAYCFALTCFEKCVYVSANCLFLENADILFDDKHGFSCGLNFDDNKSLDLSIFMVKPMKKVWTQIGESARNSSRDFSNEYLSIWLKNQAALLQMGNIKEGMISEFLVSSGKLLSDKTHTSIIRFVTGNLNGTVKPTLINFLKKAGTGLNEKLIIEKWLTLYDEITPTLNVNSLPAFEPNEILTNEPIAIVGMSCRYPGANSLKEFWNLLYSGEEGIREPPTFRWIKEHTLRVTQQDRKSQAGFLSQPVDQFDAGFFGVSPKEAVYLDPQTRLLHEVLWESLEDAGINPQSLYGSHTGIFTGSWMNDYKDIVQGSAEKDFFRTYMGSSIGASAARLSFLLGLTGPSVATESGCSSAIVALDLAVKSLRSGETNLALAGGVNLLLHPFNSSIMEYVISPNGRCKTFDANADGFGRAEGCGVLVLKRLSDALQNRDNIWAVIRGSAVSQEGISRSLGRPTVHCEALAMQLAMENGNVKPEQVSFVETHGTGTQVGDPMEIAAIAKAYHTPYRNKPLVIGSVKTNVGHTESCSGITGIMKAVLALKHEIIPKHRNLETLNPEIFLESVPALIPMENLSWPKISGLPRICGVSSFGITGTDGHVIIEEAPDHELPKFNLGLERPVHLITISGKTSQALSDLLNEYQNRFAENTADNDLANVAYTANVGRAVFNHRAFLVASGYQDAKDKKFVQGEVKDGTNLPICFLFTGQGSQYPGMAKLLYETSPVFRVAFDRCDTALKKMYNLSIKKILWKSDSKELSRTIYSQTSIFCVEYCLLKLWQSWGIKPDYVLGHSLGEFCAAVAAGVLTFENALKLVAERSRLIDNLPRGSMLVVKASKPEVEKWMKHAQIDLDFAAVNNLEQTVVAGNTKTVEDFHAFLKKTEVKAIMLDATHAFHSRDMDPMLEEYRKVAQTINYAKDNGNIQYVSGMEGRIIEDFSELGAEYWVRHTRQPVSFMEACAALRDTGCLNYLEVGPQPILSSFVMLNNEDLQLNCFPSLRKGANDWETILTSLGKMYLLGYQVDWQAYDEPYIRKKVSLPFHPFHRKSFWVDCTSNSSATSIHPLLGCQLNNASALNIFQNDLMPKSLPYLKDHCIGNRIIFPGAGFTEMCLSAGYIVANGLSEALELPSRAIRLENLRVDAPLELKEDKVCRFQAIVDLPENTQKDYGFRVKIYHQNTLSSEECGKWVLHASSTFVPVASTKECMRYWNPNRIPEIISSVQPTSSENFYKTVDDTGLKFGPHFKMIRRYWTIPQKESDEIVAEMELPGDCNKYLLHPLIIDAVFQAGILTAHRYSTAKLKVPVRVGRLTLFPCQDLGEMIYLHVWKEKEKHVLFISTKNWNPVAFVEDVELVSTTVKTIESVLEQQCSAIPDSWEETWKVLPSPFNTQVASMVESQGKFEGSEFLEEARAIGNNTLEEREIYDKNMRLIYLYILNACQELGWKPEVGERITVEGFCSILGIQKEFWKLVRFYFTVFEEDAGLLKYYGEEKWQVVASPLANEAVVREMTKLTRELKGTKQFMDVTYIHENIAKNLSQILVGKQSALSLLFPTEEKDHKYSADAYYQCHPSRAKMVSLARLVMSTAFRQSETLDKRLNGGKGIYRLLEVGAGTGSLSSPLLTWLRDVWGNRFEMYYTDISQSFFVKAEQKLEEFKGNLKFEVFNIEQSPLSQGIPVDYFDIVCATDVLHATRDLEETLVHLRQTLRPGGMICFTETVIPARDITFVFGLLEGYWRFEDFHRRPYHCCGGDELWSEALSRSGFQGFQSFKACVDQFACLAAMADPRVKLGTLVASRVLREPIQRNLPGWVIFGDGSNFEMAARLANALVASGNRVVVALKPGQSPVPRKDLRVEVNLQEIQFEHEDDASRIEMVLGAGVQGLVYCWGMDLNEKDQKAVALPFLHIVKRLLLMGQQKPPKVYVVTQGVNAVNEDTVTCYPSAATLNGMVKSLKNECFDMFVRCVDLEVDVEPEVKANQVLYELARWKGIKEQHRLQVAYRGTVRYEPRLGKAQPVRQSDELKLPPSSNRYHLVLPKSKMIQDLEFEPLEMGSVGQTEIEVKVKAYALNFRDIFAIIKPSAEFDKLNAVGLDFAGVVVKAGPEAKWKVGQRVFGCYYKDEQLPSHYVLDSRSVTEIPESMSDWEAATMPAVFSTAYHCLINVAKMKKGDKVLIHTGSGGVGLAAIQLAKIVGAEVITTAGNPRKRAYLRSLGIQHVFRSRDTSYEQDILRVTNGQGVDIVLNSITGPGIKEATLRATGKNGRFVEMSKLSIWTPEEVKAIRPDVEYSIVDLTTVDEETHVDLLKRMHAYLASGQMKAIPFVKFDALRIRQALQYFQKAKHIGKVVVAMPEVSTQQGQYKTQVKLFNSQSSYLITGGLGGIGFEVCKWMLGMGATDIALTGRRAPAPEMAEQIKGLQNEGHNILVKLGDIGNAKQCKTLIDEIQREMKPLRGIMHCAGVLRDNLYPNQTWEGFQATFSSKVDGTWNLHEFTKELQLEHFVVYSSVTALVGTPGQPNHAAANCFEDAFIHYRHSLGLPGLSINWGQWAQVGCAKEINVLSLLPVSVKRMLNGLETAMRAEKKQVAFCDFASISNLSAMCPMIKSYLEERLLKKYASTQAQSTQELNGDKFWEEMDKAVNKSEKMSVLSGYLKTILRNALRLDPDEKLSETANIQELGVDSLMMIELKNAIQGLLGSRLNVTANLLKNCNTIQLISGAVVGKIMEEKGDDLEDNIPLEPLDSAELLELLQKDAQLPAEVHIAPGTIAGLNASQMKRVLVTGATGQLGPYILQEICSEYKSVEKIYCLVRGAMAEEKLKAFLKEMGLEDKVDWDKIEVVVGNVALDRLGISEEKYDEVCKMVDGVIHLAAKTHVSEHLRPSSENGKGTDCRSVNIVGTVNVLKFACTGKIKHVFYASTLPSGIFGESRNDSGLPDTWTNTEVLQTIVDNKFPGLQSSKWICEILLEQANRRGIPCKVFRFPWIAGNSKTGQVNVLNNTYILRFLGFLKLGVMPDLVIPAAVLPADICASVALKLFMNDSTPNEIFNVAHPQPEVEQEFVRVAQEEFGKTLEILSWKDFTERLDRQEENGDQEELRSMYRDQKQLSKYFADAASFVTKYSLAPQTYFANEKLCRFIPDFGKGFPSTMETVRKDMQYVKRTGLREKFGI